MGLHLRTFLEAALRRQFSGTGKSRLNYRIVQDTQVFDCRSGLALRDAIYGFAAGKKLWPRGLSMQ